MKAALKSIEVDNTEIANYLEFYIGMNGAPGFAVFLNGEWGSGKTWFINKFRETQESQKKHKFIYVSLYGVTSISEIEDQFFQQLHPILASKPLAIGTKLVKSTIKAALKFDLDGDKKDDLQVNANPSDLSLQKFLTDSENRILIFDDLERCAEPQRILGYINHFVEHQGQKVILIGHEEEIPQLKEHKRKNEKVIGRSFTVNAELKEAFSAFIAVVRNEKVKKLLTDNSELILGIYNRSAYKNLRTLKYSVIEYERFFSLLPDKSKSHEQFQRASINAFFSLCIEIKSGKITVEAVRNLAEHYSSFLAQKVLSKKKSAESEQPETDPISEIYKRHFSSSKQEIIPNEESLHFFFKYGFIPDSVAQDSVNNCRFFIEEKTPSWIKLWHIYNLTDDEFDKCFKEALDTFKNHGYKKQGELRHVVGILIFLSKKKIIPLSYKQAVALITKVVNAMVKKNLIEPLSELEEAFPRFDDVYAGLQFSEYKDDCFKQISDTLKEYQKQRNSENIKSSSSDLISIMREDSRKFWAALTVSNSIDRKFYSVPILHHLSVKDFLKAFVEMNPAYSSRLNVGYMFKERYKLLSSYPELAVELQWLKQLNSSLNTNLKKLKQPSKYHLEYFRDTFLLEAIKVVEDFQKHHSNPKSEP